MTSRVPAWRTVPETKITEYLLNRTHRVGGPKAAFFLARGFSTERRDEMADALAAHPDRNLVETTSPTPWGLKYVVRCSVETPNGRNPCIRTVWREDGAGGVVLVTAYPAD